MFYSLWYNAPKLLPAGGMERGGSVVSAFQATVQQQLGCIIQQAVKHSLALLRMAKNFLKHVELIGISINCYCCILLVFYIIYIVGMTFLHGLVFYIMISGPRMGCMSSTWESTFFSTHTYLLTPWCRVLLEKLAGLQLVKKFPAFYGT